MVSTKALSLVCLLKLLLLCLCLLLLLLLFIAVEAGTVVVDEEEQTAAALNDVRALLQFKKSITSDPLSLLNDWDADAPNACNWTGISCSIKHPGRVVEILLENATLRGSLSPHVSNLSFLQVLDIENNSFSGIIPSSLGTLRRLKVLDLCVNDHVSNLSFLQVLDIENNSFSGIIPSSLGTLRRLKVLDLCVNEFEGGIPHEVGNLSSLRRLVLCANSLSGQIPQSLATLKDLTLFAVYENQLVGQIPSWLGAFHKLEYLDLSSNNIHGVIPAQLGNLSSLHNLVLQFNHLTGFIPCSLARLSRLSILYLDENNLSGTVSPCLRNLTALTSLYLSVNNLQGGLPSWIGSLNKLQGLGLEFNTFTGNIPSSWRNLTQLQIFQLSRNRLSGTPPSWLGSLCTQMTFFNLGRNNFTSGVSTSRQPIPILEALSNCSLLIYLGLYRNHLTGTLPPTFGSSLPNLQHFSLFSNFISGNVPQSLGNLSALIELDLYHNALSGPFPPQIANLKSLQGLFLASNKFHGNIPAEISLLNQSLAYVYLSENMLSGSIPVSIGKLINLRELHIYRNLLSGKIPSEMGNCAVLEDLVLSANNLSGAIPPELAGLKTIVFDFVLSENALTGEVPPEIAGLQMAQYIDLSSNQLAGTMASYMDNWLDARHINLSFNHFSGNFSKSIGNKLTQLRSIDLSCNNFTGPVPASLLNHSTLHFLNFSYNNFDEEFPCPDNSSSKKLRLTRWSFVGNPDLCGRCFGLKACLGSPPQQHKSHFHKNSILKIVLSILGGLLLLVVTAVLLVFRRRNKTLKGEIPAIGESFLKISVEELRRATDNFSASNLVGEGSHGKVHRGVLRSGMVVAVKCLSCTDERRTVQTFKKECRALGKVRHRNVMKIITVVLSEELKAFVMPFMSNGNLHSFLHSKEDGQLSPLKLQIRVKILTELARALAYLHHDCDFQVIHCDIKPENVLFDDNMTVKLSDFGISRLIGDFDGPPMSSSFAVKGSVGYVAPEYGIGESISEKGDVYSFGVVTLEVITRLKPTHAMFSGDLTLPSWISMTLQGKSGEERREAVKDVIKTADECGGGIEMDNDEEMSAVESILLIGLRCTCQNASMRLNMKEVESSLQSIYPLNLQNRRALPGNLEEVISVVESQPPLNNRREKARSSTFSSD